MSEATSTLPPKAKRPRLRPLIAKLRRRASALRYTPTLAINNTKAITDRELTAAEERVLFRALSHLKPGSTAYLDLRDLLVTHNLRLVIHFAGVTDPQKLAEAEDGPIRAVERFDYRRGFKFSTYAVRAVLQRARRAWKNRLRIDTHEITETSLRGKRQDGIPTRPLDRHGKLDAGFGHLERQEERNLLQRAMDCLAPREREVLRRRFWEDQTLDQAAGAIGLTKERVRQIQNQGLANLRQLMRYRSEAHPAGIGGGYQAWPRLLALAAGECHTTVEAIIGSGRSANAIRARWVVCYIVHQHLRLSYQDIAERLGRTSRTTAVNLAHRVYYDDKTKLAAKEVLACLMNPTEEA